MEGSRDSMQRVSGPARTEQGDGPIHCGCPHQCKQEEGCGGCEAGGHHAPCHGQACEGSAADDKRGVRKGD